MADQYWNPTTELMAPDERRKLQEYRFLKMFRHVVGKSPFYQELYREANVDLDKIQSLDDIRRLPKIDKYNYRKSQARKPPYGDYTGIDVEQAMTLHSSGGTTGKPMIYLDSRLSWEWASDVFAYCCAAQGIGPGSRVFFPFNYSTFIGYWGFHYGVEKVGGCTMPAGGFDTKTRVKMMLDFGTTNVMAMPSYALTIGQTAQEMGIDLAKDSTIIGVHHAAEPGGSIPGTKRRIEAYFNNSYDNYGMVELGATSMFECGQKNGMHVIEDHFYLEVLDPESGEPVKEGEVGELVWTNIGLRGFDAQPLIRCSSKDLARYTTERCACGRTFIRVLGGVLGRTDDTKKVKGVLLYPTAIETCLAGFPQLGHEWEAIITRINDKDDLTIQIELDTSAMREDDVKGLARKVQDTLRTQVFFTAKIEFVAPGAIGSKYEGVLKPTWKRVVDKRDVPF